MISVSELREGIRARISEKELAAITGHTQGTLQQYRVKGRGPGFEKDPITGRVYYRTEEVLKYLDQTQSCRSTSEYSSGKQQENLEKARKAHNKPHNVPSEG